MIIVNILEPPADNTIIWKNNNFAHLEYFLLNAGQCLRAGDTVELPTDDVVVEDGGVFGGRQHGCAQAGGGVPSDSSEVCRARRQGWNSARCHQYRYGQR